MFKVRLFTSVYVEENRARRRELQECLARNADCPLIDEICLLQERQADPGLVHPKLTLYPIHRRPLYDDFFQLANQLCAGKDDFSIIANGDIYFDRTLSALVQYLKDAQCAALSRWDVRSDGEAVLFNRSDSQDAWVFRGPIRCVVSDFCVGIPRCDNRILCELRQAGYEVVNPSFSVRSYHLHAGERAEYPAVITGQHVAPPYAYEWPGNLLSWPETVLWNLSHPDSRLSWQTDARRWKQARVLKLGRRLLNAARRMLCTRSR